ncbi:MAG: protein-disulfide reductase DsbD domain-containing protein [Bacteroidota bacterium]
MLRLLHVLLWVALLGLAQPASAQSTFDSVDARDPSPFSDAALVPSATAVAPGDTLEIALVLTQDPGWHSYWLNAGDSGEATTIEWQLPAGVTAGDLRFPTPMPIELAGLVSYGYEDEVALLTTVVVDSSIEPGTIQIEGSARWLICADVCLPATAEVATTIDIGKRASANAERFAEWHRLLPTPAMGWTTEAVETPAGFDLRVIPPGDWQGAMEGAYFFPLDKGLVQYGAPQVLSRDAEAHVLSLAGSGIASPPDVLTGILALGDGETVDGERRSLAVRAPVLSSAVVSAPADAGVASLWVALLLAFGGGLLLNLMPCVFPILGLKIMGFAQDREPAERRRHGLLFGAGVLVSFLALASLLLALRAAGEAIGWGFQLQSPLVVAALAILMTGLGLWLLGVVEFGGRVMGLAAQADGREGAVGAFLSGVLATLVATPCTAPFMGAALGWALVQPAAASLAVFAALGIGMAMPYVALSFVPAWVRRLPRPGPWMETLKQALAFPMLLTAVWLVWTFGTQTGINGAALLLVALVLVGLAAWVVGRWHTPSASRRALAVTRTVALLALLGAVALTVAGAGQQAAPSGPSTSVWAPYDRAHVEDLVAAGEPVFIDFTAAWCLTCQANKASTLRLEEVERAFTSKGVHLFSADWTSRDDEITRALADLGRSGVPVYALYTGTGPEPVLLPELLTPSIVRSALEAIPTPAAS